MLRTRTLCVDYFASTLNYVSASEVTTLRCYTNMFIIIIIKMVDDVD